MKDVETNECQEVPFFFLHAAFRSTLNLFRVIVQFGCFFCPLQFRFMKFT